MSILALRWAFPIQITGAKKAVLLALCDHHNESRGDCYPSVERLSKDAGVCPRTVRTAIQDLRTLGLIRISQSAGRRSNDYVLLINEAVGADLAAKQTRQNKRVTRQTAILNPAKETPNHANLTTNQATTAPKPIEPRKNLKITIKEPSLAVPADDAFAQFWRDYPRKKEGRAACQKSWASAVRRASPGEILSGLRRYPFKTDFLPMASTWLNQSRWTSEPDTAPVTRERPRYQNAALELLARDLETSDDEQETRTINGHAEAYGLFDPPPIQIGGND